MVYAGGGVDITLIGEKELQRKFKGLPGKLQRKIVRAAMKKAIEPVLQDAQSKAPVLTGKLKASLKVMSSNKYGKITTSVVTGEGFFKGDQFYGAFVELGTKHQPAKPFRLKAAKIGV